MDRLACIHLPAFPLQVLRLREPDAAGLPMVVVDRDHPGGNVLFVNQRAWASRIRPGMRFASALSLCGDLRAGVVSPTESDEALERVIDVMRAFTPGVEPSPRHPGVLWLDASGLHRIYESPAAWLHELLAAVDALGFVAHGVLGFSRFRTWALSLGRAVPRIFEHVADERRATAQVAIERLALPPRVIDTLEQLGVRTIGDLVALPSDGLRERIGAEALALWRDANGDEVVPIRGVREPEIACVDIDLDHRESDSARLLVLLASHLHPLIAQVANRSQQVSAVRFVLRLDDRRVLDESVRPAAPTCDAAILLDLVRLRLERCPLSAGVVGAMLVCTGVLVEIRQAPLLLERPRRDIEAANRAVARLCADLGDAAVARLAPADGHLPEARWRWVPTNQVGRPMVQSPPAHVSFVRTLNHRPVPLPSRPRYEPDGWLAAGREAGPVTHFSGPFVVSGGWWANEIHREYYYIETRRGDLMWIFYDRRRRSWFSHGMIR